MTSCSSSAQDLRGETLARVACDLAHEKKAEEPVLLNVQGTAAPADWILICSADNAAHCRAIFDGIYLGLKNRGQLAWHVEGKEQGRWMLLDYVELIVHILLPELREYYQLEKLWKPRSRHTRKD